jgi:transposase-like protein
LSVRAFCSREGLAETALYSWRRVLRERDGEGARPGFVPVAVVAEPAGGDDADDSLPIVIELRGGRVMRLGALMPAGRVAAIVHAIESGDGRPGAIGGAA